MKKAQKILKLLVCLTFIILACIVFVACGPKNTAKFTVTFETNGGTTLSPITGIENDNMITAPTQPTKLGYTFSGWYKDAEFNIAWDFANDKVIVDTILYAKWILSTYIITYDYQYADSGNSELTYTVTYGESYTLVTPEKDEYAFGGWYSEANGAGAQYTNLLGECSNEWNETEGRTLFAYWEAETTVGLIFTKVPDRNEYAVKGTSTSYPSGRIIIPKLYDGWPVTRISPNAFEFNTVITSIVIPKSVTSIDNNAFYLCTSLASAAFESDSQLSSIGDNAFRNCEGLTTIKIPRGVISISDRAFSSCNNFTTVKIPRDVISIGDYAFSSCYRLTNVTFEVGSQLESIGTYAFYGCNSIKSITIPAMVTNVGTLFLSCEGLTSITVDSGNTVYHSAGDCLIETATKILVAGCNASIIPRDGSVTSIAVTAFSYFPTLTSIIIPATVISIGYRAFYYCSNLASVTFETGSQLESIGDNAFRYCSNLTSIIVPATVTNIGVSAFSGCSNLASVFILRTVVQGITALDDINVFGNVSTIFKIYVPDLASQTAYKGAANWSSYADKIEVGNLPA